MKKNMFETEFHTILPYLLRPSETLSRSEIETIFSIYSYLGRKNIETVIEKQSRCYVSLVLSKIGCDSEYWTTVHNEYVGRNTQIKEIVDKISQDFFRHGGNSLTVYENFGAVLSSGISIGCFASGDVDFTVSEEELDLAIHVFKQNGFTADKREDHVEASKKLVLPFYNPNALDRGYWLNIMRKPIARDLFLNQDAYQKRLHTLQENYTETYKDTNIHLLKPTAMLYFNALHFACEHFYSASPGMALCCDIDRVIRAREIDWNLLKKWETEDKAGLRIQLALDICKFFLKTPIPNGIWTKRSKYYYKLWNRLIDEHKMLLNPQNSRLARLKVELLSDDYPIILSLLNRSFHN